MSDKEPNASQRQQQAQRNQQPQNRQPQSSQELIDMNARRAFAFYRSPEDIMMGIGNSEPRQEERRPVRTYGCHHLDF